MPRPAKSDRVNVEQALRAAVEETIEKHLNRLFKGKPLADEMKEVRGAVARIEKRLEALDQKIGGRLRHAAGAGSPGRPPLHEGCKIEGCNAEHYALGLCSKHYQQERRAQSDAAREAALRKTRAKIAATRGRAKARRAR